jgi:hypothetical protein
MRKCLYIIALVVIIGSLVRSVAIFNKTDPASYWITNKYEYNGHYYVDIQVEISADDYIGYDIGDEYIMNH